MIHSPIFLSHTHTHTLIPTHIPSHAHTDSASSYDTLDGSPPRWSLADLFSGPNDPKISEELGLIAADAKQFRDHNAGTFVEKGLDHVLQVVATYEKLMERLAKIEAFVFLYHSTRMDDHEAGRLLQTGREQSSQIQKNLLFVTLEIRNAPLDHDVFTKTQDARHPYHFFFRRIKAFKPYELSDDLEEYLEESSAVNDQAWVRFYDESKDSLRFDFKGSSLTLSEVMHRMASANKETRYLAAEVLGKGLLTQKRQSAFIINTLMAQKSVVDRRRGYKEAQHERHLLNEVDAEVVGALVSSVEDSYVRLSQRYFKLKARWLNNDPVLDYRDRLAPVPTASHREYSWQQGVDLILESFDSFAPWMKEKASILIDAQHIDAQARAGKSPGGFMYPTPPSMTPYILVNYRKKTRDVMILAHELGHGVHQMLAGSKGYIGSSTPLILAETASVFAEMITFQNLLKQTTDDDARLGLIATKVESMLATSVSQIVYYQFECALHRERNKGEVSAERINQIWLDANKRAYGDAMSFDDEVFGIYWSYISHFIHVPFYVYAYAFGECLVCSLYDLYQKSHPDFVDKFYNLLQAGGAMGYQDLLDPFGINAADPGFWKGGLGVLEGMIDQIETLLNQGGHLGHKPL